MCFSATVSFSAAAVLMGTGAYALQQARRMAKPYFMWALVPVLFGLQQAFEGLVWHQINSGDSGRVLTFALAFHFFSHFLWLWWFPLCSYLVEPNKLRKKIFGVCAAMGIFSGALVYATIMLHPEWMTVSIEHLSIKYQYHVPYQSNFNLPIRSSVLYVLIILVPLAFSSHKHIRIFGGLIFASMVFASLTYSYAYVSVWCFFAAVLSLYLVYMIRQFAKALMTNSGSSAI